MSDTHVYRVSSVHVAHQANPKLKAEAGRVQSIDLVSGDVTPSVGADVCKLWQDEGVQRTWARKASFCCLTRRYRRHIVGLCVVQVKGAFCFTRKGHTYR